jgi:uncharacterized membrane protein
LMPMSIFQAASYSPDGLLFGSCMLLVASILRLAFSEGKSITARDLILSGLCLFVIAAIKPVYITLGGLLLLIPREKMPGQVRFLASGLGLLTFACIPAILWLVAISGGAALMHTSDPVLQLSLFRSDLPHFAGLLFRSMLMNTPSLTRMGIGFLGWVDTPLPLWVTFSYLVAIIMVILFDTGKIQKLTLGQRMIPLILYFFTSIAMNIYSYIYWSLPGAELVQGIQGRYFIPLIPLLAIIPLNQKFHLPRWTAIAVILFCTLILSVTGYSIVRRYYIHGSRPFVYRPLITTSSLSNATFFAKPASTTTLTTSDTSL